MMHLPKPLLNDRAFVRELHQAYADKTQSHFSGLARASGDPCNVRIRNFGATRTFIASGHDWHNRATLVGDETAEQIGEIVRYFAEQRACCHIEWNPGNCYRPNSWNDELGRILLDRGFQPGGFRCVWTIDLRTVELEITSPIEVRSFQTGSLDEFLDTLAAMEKQSEVQRAQSELNIGYGQADEHWRQYVGYIDSVPCCNATLFMRDRIACLEWSQTLETYRGLSCHNALIRRRLTDARSAGCELAYAVTDIGIPSARNLQRHGFQLAYNYIMLKREPTAMK